MAQIGKALLSVERYRVINLRTDAAFGEKLFESVALLHSNHVLVEYMTLARHRYRRDELRPQDCTGQGAVIECRIALPRLRPAVQVLELHAQHRGLQFID